MRKLMMAAVAVMGMSLGSPAAEAKEPHKETQAQPRQGPTDAEIDEAHQMNKEHDAHKARASIKTQEVKGKVQSASGSELTIRMPSKLNRKMDFKTDEQSKVMKDSQSVALSDLKEGDEVRVSYQIIGKERIVVNVDAQQPGSHTSEPAKKP
jgi:hypothetical protein